jgi:hypothetical protein
MSFPFVQPYFGLGNSLQTAQGGAGAVGGWVELGRTTLGSSGDSIDVSSLADKRYYMLLRNGLATGGNINFSTQFNGDSGSNYASRWSSNGGSDSTGGSRTSHVNSIPNAAVPIFDVAYFVNLSANEKLWMIPQGVTGSASGASSAPQRRESVSKWTNTSNPVSSIETNNTEAGSYNTGSEVVVLGWDPTDTHTTNFWEELASVDWSSGTAINSGTITAKKYLWVQGWIKSGTAGMNALFTFNSDTGSNYNNRKASNGGSDATGQRANLDMGGSAGTANLEFVNMFIVNNSANEKLCICQSVDQSTAGAGTAPTRKEAVGKWANTSAQITEINMDGNATLTDGTLKVWGSD